MNTRQVKTSAAGFAIAAALVVLALSPAWFAHQGDGTAALAVFALFHKLCHQRAGRSFVFFGIQSAVCIRCLGIYAGAAFGSLLRLNRRVAIRFLGVALTINCADVVAESIGLHGNMSLSRLLIGAALGLAIGVMFSVEFPAQSCDEPSSFHSEA